MIEIVVVNTGVCEMLAAVCCVTASGTHHCSTCNVHEHEYGMKRGEGIL